MSKFTPTASTINELLGEIRLGKLGLPAFQRRFKWERAQVRELLGSVFNDYPAGSLLFYCPGETGTFGRRPIEAAPALKATPDVTLILDGQQRLTSLWGALEGKDPDGVQYLLRVDAVLDGEDPEDWVTYAVPQYRKRRGRDEWYLRYQWLLNPSGRMEKHEAPLDVKGLRLLPLPVLVDDLRCLLWLQDVGLDEAQLKRVRTVRDQVLTDYKFPVITLDANTTPDRVAFIFEKVNSTGLKLSLFELLNAKLYREPTEGDGGLHLADLWVTARKEFPRLDRFGIKDLFFLQTLALLHTRGRGGAAGCKRKDIFGLTVEDVRALWTRALRAVDGVLQLMEDKAGIRNAKWFPFPTMVPALAALFDHFDARLHGKPEYNRWVDRTLRWYWCSVFANRYGNAVETKLPADVRAVIRWVDEDEQPDWMKLFRFSAATLRQSTSPSAAVYQGVFCLVLRTALDFHNTTPLTWERIQKVGAEDHHIFPKSRVKDTFDWRLVNCVLNRTLIDWDTNRKIRNKWPSEYFPLIRTENARFDDILASHGIPTGEDSPERDDEFLRFLNLRERVIGGLIAEATGCAVVDYQLSDEDEQEGDLLLDEGEAAPDDAAVEEVA